MEGQAVTLPILYSFKVLPTARAIVVTETSGFPVIKLQIDEAVDGRKDVRRDRCWYIKSNGNSKGEPYN